MSIACLVVHAEGHRSVGYEDLAACSGLARLEAGIRRLTYFQQSGHLCVVARMLRTGLAVGAGCHLVPSG